MTITRIWKRDRSTNAMPLDVAVRNIVRNSGRTPKDVRETLLAGGECETKRAVFVMDPATFMASWNGE